jgi:hypothetical protein
MVKNFLRQQLPLYRLLRLAAKMNLDFHRIAQTRLKATTGLEQSLANLEFE